MDLFELTPAEINKELNCNTIALMDPVTHKRPSAMQHREIVILWQRDRQRYDRTEELKRTSGIWSSHCTSNMTHIQLSGNNVHKTSYIATLLHNVRDNLIYRQGVYHMEPMGQTRFA